MIFNECGAREEDFGLDKVILDNQLANVDRLDGKTACVLVGAHIMNDWFFLLCGQLRLSELLLTDLFFLLSINLGLVTVCASRLFRC